TPTQNAISNFAVHDPDVIFVMEAIMVIITQTGVVAVLFVPKVIEIMAGRGNENSTFNPSASGQASTAATGAANASMKQVNNVGGGSYCPPVMGTHALATPTSPNGGHSHGSHSHGTHSHGTHSQDAEHKQTAEIEALKRENEELKALLEANKKKADAGKEVDGEKEEV
ncbi:hypothetical protein HK101_004924, partial [Irineochytrium annulatum]